MDIITLIVVLILGALICFVLEILTPTFGILGALGIAAIVAAIWLTFTINQVLGTIMIFALVLLVPVYLWMVVKVLPKSPLGKRLFLRKAADGTGDAAPIAESYDTLVGMIGTAETPLRPAGAVRVDGKRFVASAESEMIESGARIKVIRSSGMNLIVSEVKEDE